MEMEEWLWRDEVMSLRSRRTKGKEEGKKHEKEEDYVDGCRSGIGMEAHQATKVKRVGKWGKGK